MGSKAPTPPPEGELQNPVSSPAPPECCVDAPLTYTITYTGSPHFSGVYVRADPVLALLKKLEHVGHYSCCAMCGGDWNTEVQNHKPGCELAAMIKTLEGT